MALTIKNKEVIRRLMQNDFPAFEDKNRERVNKIVFDFNTDSIMFYEDLDFICSYNLLRYREQRLEQLLNEASFNS